MTTRDFMGAWGMVAAMTAAACGVVEPTTGRDHGGGGAGGASGNATGATSSATGMSSGVGTGSGGMMGSSSGSSSSTSTGMSSGTGTSTTSSGGAAGSAGTGGGAGRDAGSSLDASMDAPKRDAGVRDAFVADRRPSDPGVLVHVVNGCGFELWLHAAGEGAVLMPDNAHLLPGDAQDYIAPDNWNAARVTAYLNVPPAGEIDKVELTISNKIVNYNITYVDWLGLPIEMRAFGSGPDCKVVGCYVPESDVLAGCPAGLLSGRQCFSAGHYCSIAANQGTPFCHALDAKVTQCAQDPKYTGCAGAQGATTPQAYACSGFFGGSTKWCAALNRGMLDNADSQNAALYYKTAPFNTYAAWVHTVCPGIYAFPYDDYGNPNESGFHACSGATQLNVTFCPAG